MPLEITRRQFVSGAAALVSLPFHNNLLSALTSTDSTARWKAEPFPLKQVRLKAGPFLDAAAKNRAYMQRIAPERLLHMFRITSGLPSNAEPLGGWEAPANELRGHFTGHYLSACAMISAHTGDDSFVKIGNVIVAALAECQKKNGNGYLSAFPEEFFDRLRAGQNVWAPFYTLHKIMAGLLDMYSLCGNEQAMDVLKGMITWTRRWTGPLGDAAMSRVLEREYGGMNEVIYNFSEITGNPDDRDLAHRFDHQRIFRPLSESRDELKGLHANTTIPKIIGAARRYELTGETMYRDIAQYFWNEVTSNRAYCTGGTSNGEQWDSDPGKLAEALSAYTQECCCTYNMMKLTRHIYGWTADPRCIDYQERALWNGILGTQHPEDGLTLYYVPLASGYWKLFALPFHSFWCCTGSGLESFSKLGENIYAHDDKGIFVNLFIASEVDWKERGIRILQETNFPEEDTTRITVRCDRPASMALRLRVPKWADSGGGVKLNGKPLDGFAEPGGYCVVSRTWKDGDSLEMKLPMSLQAQPLPGDPSTQAFSYGPIVLAGRLGTQGLAKEDFRAEPTKPRTVPEYKKDPVAAPAFKTGSQSPSDWIRPLPGKPLTFQATSQEMNVEMAPFYKIFDERYAIYWKVNS